jgi:hypothetical protein
MMTLSVLSIIILFLSINLILTDEAFLARLDMSKNVVDRGINPLGKGIGFVTVSGFVKEVVVFDNDFLRFIYEIGIIGLLSFLIFVFSSLNRHFKVENITLTVFLFLLMYTGEIHSMYPIPVIIYTSFAIISRKHLLSEPSLT